MTAALAPAGGTKITDTSAPVAAMVSADRAEHGNLGAVQLDGRAGLLRVGPADHLRAGGEHARAVLAALASR